MLNESLYFIAILAPPDIAEQVAAIKNEIAQRFESRHALKLPPHITLQAPFSMHDEKVIVLKSELTLHFCNYSAINMELKDFGCFGKKRNPVIFIQLQENLPLGKLHEELMFFLRRNGFPENKTSLDFHPHLTVAHRDLSPHHFRKAWSEFQHRAYCAEFVARSVHLLKHDGKNWIPTAEFPLRAE